MTATDVFYTPHADDETLAMAGAILRARAAGHRIVLVLVTDNTPSRRAVDLYSNRLRCRWHQGEKHDFGMADIRECRLLEFTDAAARLGADEVATLGIPEQLGREDYPRFVEAIGLAVRRYTTMYPAATHHFIRGAEDLHATVRCDHVSHRACADAGLATVADRTQLQFHRVYVYSQPAEMRTAQRIERLSPAIMEQKREALDAYRVWEPTAGRLAFGYHSVPELFDAATTDPREFVDLVPA